MAGFFPRLLKWQNYMHYILLIFGLWLWKFIPWSVKINFHLTSGDYMWYPIALLWYALAALVVDTIIHGFFWILPYGKGRWRD